MSSSSLGMNNLRLKCDIMNEWLSAPEEKEETMSQTYGTTTIY